MNLQSSLTSIEQVFNFFGALPAFAIVSSTVRALAATVQTAVSGIVGLIALVGMFLFHHSPKWERLATQSLEILSHGMMNLCRAFIEYTLGITIVGSLGLMIYQAASENRFAPIVKYSAST